MKTSSTTIRKFTLIVLSVYFGSLALIIAGAALSGKLAVGSVGNAFLYIGIAIFILGFLSMGATSKISGAPRGVHLRNDKQFMGWRKQERPIELVTWAIILAAALMAVTGYILLRLVYSV